ncbi:hypothetical protein HALA3H3_450005 [Halomonas sp. A3H3]|nr:conserved hypothetical protein [Halomonas sp. 113]CAD5272680.1 conserved hypothetical protein [Halomonas sp. 59]CAD5282950.1 conserved hypothetical protein [Halomonas sp. I3]CAD5286466.1 conserved hypothetical protein [Halomonas sp. 156]CDG52956.1 hypothetical protein HALA3H3_450005 [Halomonas sp. A3H3]VXB81241.1 conserved hypothetical protein [Halomonas titanicae]
MWVQAYGHLPQQATTTPQFRAVIRTAPSNISGSERARKFNFTNAVILLGGAGGCRC